jgi:hypothetical protein
MPLRAYDHTTTTTTTTYGPTRIRIVEKEFCFLEQFIITQKPKKKGNF